MNDSQRPRSPLQRTLDETLPCFEGSSLPPDVLALQKELDRISQEAENSTITTTKTEERNKRTRNRSRRKDDTTREQTSTRHKITETSKEFRNYLESDKKSTTSAKSLRTPHKSEYLKAQSSSKENSIKKTQVQENVKEYPKKNLSSSLPAKILKSKFEKDTEVKRKPRRTSEPTHEVSKTDKSGEVNENLGQVSAKGTCLCANTTVSKKTGQIFCEKSSVVEKNDASLGETSEYKAIYGEEIVNMKEREKLKSQSNISKTSLTTKVDNVTAQDFRTDKSTSSEAKSLKHASHLFHDEHRGEDDVKHAAANFAASESYDSACSKCKVLDRYSHAKSYCLDCSHYLCDHCLRRHNRNLTRVDHHIIQGKSMPGSFTIKKYETKRKTIDRCSYHQKKDIKCFCTVHNTLCCSECKSRNHEKCKMQSLEHLLIQTPDVRKFKQNTSETSKRQLESLLKLCSTLKSNREIMAKEKTSIIEEVKSKASLMTNHIKKLEKDFIEYVSETFNKDEHELDKDIEECENNIEVISKDIQYLDEPKATQESKIKALEWVKQIEMKTIPDRLQSQFKDETVRNAKAYQFEIDKELFKNVTKNSSIGKLVVIVSDKSQLNTANDTANSSCIEEEGQFELQISKSVGEFRSISIWSKGDVESQTCFTSVELLEDGTFLVSDINNMKLKWFDSELSLIKSLKLSSEPWGIAILKANTCIVTLPMESSYQEVQIVNGNINFGEKVALGVECICAVALENQLLFAGIDGDQPTFLLTDLDGKNKERVLTDETLQQFQRPNHLLKSLFNPMVVFVSDVDTGVFAMNIESKALLFHYTNSSLVCPMGMSVTYSGHLYICSQQTHCLQCISMDGKYLYTVSLESIVDMRAPQCICYLPRTNEFLLTTDSSYSLVRFNLS